MYIAAIQPPNSALSPQAKIVRTCTALGVVWEGGGSLMLLHTGLHIMQRYAP